MPDTYSQFDKTMNTFRNPETLLPRVQRPRRNVERGDRPVGEAFGSNALPRRPSVQRKSSLGINRTTASSRTRVPNTCRGGHDGGALCFVRVKFFVFVVSLTNTRASRKRVERFFWPSGAFFSSFFATVTSRRSVRLRTYVTVKSETVFAARRNKEEEKKRFRLYDRAFVLDIVSSRVVRHCARHDARAAG